MFHTFPHTGDHKANPQRPCIFRAHQDLAAQMCSKGLFFTLDPNGVVASAGLCMSTNVVYNAGWPPKFYLLVCPAGILLVNRLTNRVMKTQEESRPVQMAQVQVEANVPQGKKSLLAGCFALDSE